jgi:hypothetical protein
MLLLVVERFISAATPFTLGEVVSTLEDKSGRSPWQYLFAYVGLRLLQSGGGLPALRGVISLHICLIKLS